MNACLVYSDLWLTMAITNHISSLIKWRLMGHICGRFYIVPSYKLFHFSMQLGQFLVQACFGMITKQRDNLFRIRIHLKKSVLFSHGIKGLIFIKKTKQKTTPFTKKKTQLFEKKKEEKKKDKRASCVQPRTIYYKVNKNKKSYKVLKKNTNC